MGSVAHEEIPPEPAPRDLAAELAGLIDRAGELLTQFAGQPGCDRLTNELIITQVQLTEVKAALRDSAASSAVRDAAFAAGRAVERAAIAEEGKARKGRHAAASSRKFGLRVVEGIAIAGGSLGAALRHSWAAHPVATVAAGMATGAATVATTAFVATAVLPGAPAHAGAAGTPNPVAGIYSAVPIAGASPSQLRLVGSVTRPKPDLDAKGAGVNPIASLGPVPSADVPSSSSSSWPSQQASQQQSQGGAQAGPATLSVGSTGLDLSGALTSATVTLSASGSGWVSWKVDTSGSDLDFSATHGVLNAGESYTLTVSLASVLDSATEQIFSVNGQQVSVNLPLPVVVPVVTPSDLPTLLPTDPPSSSGN